MLNTAQGTAKEEHTHGQTHTHTHTHGQAEAEAQEETEQVEDRRTVPHLATRAAGSTTAARAAPVRARKLYTPPAVSWSRLRRGVSATWEGARSSSSLSGSHDSTTTSQTGEH